MAPSTKALISKNIVAELGIEALPDAEKVALIERIASTIEKSVFIRVYDALSEDDQDALSNALTMGDMMGVETLLANNPQVDLEQIVQEETSTITSQLKAAVTA